MSAIIKACLVADTIKNTGKECDTSMVATAMLIAVPKSLTFTSADLEDFYAFLTTKIHAAKASRVYPLFGQQAPIRTIQNDSESDVMVTLDDGSKEFLRYGFYNRTFETTSGGICYADALQSLNKSGYSVIEIDQQGQILVKQNKDGSYSGLTVDFMYSPSPVLADFKSTPYKNRFMISFSPIEYVNNGVILAGGSDLLGLMGLIDAVITKNAAATTTTLTIGVKAKCSETDLIALFGAALADIDNFIVTNKATGAFVTPSAIAIVGGNIVLTGTYVSGTTYTVKGAAASVWFGNSVEGYDAASGGVDILIP